MRYDKKVTFLKHGPRTYDPDAGASTGGPVVIGSKFCHAHELGVETTLQVYGKADLRALGLHHMGRMLDADLVIVDGVTYAVKVKRELPLKASYIVGEIKL